MSNPVLIQAYSVRDARWEDVMSITWEVFQGLRRIAARTENRTWRAVYFVTDECPV